MTLSIDFYETNRLNPDPFWPNLISSYNDGFTSVASGIAGVPLALAAECICDSVVVLAEPFDDIVIVFDASGSMRQATVPSLWDKAEIYDQKMMRK